jgi:uncharacterized repeat protein (TIGR03803 family)
MRRTAKELCKPSHWRRLYAVFALWAAAAFALPAQTFTTLFTFDGTDGGEPKATLVQGTDGNYYGTTFYGGGVCSYCGTVFKITPSGTLTTLFNFDATDGLFPYGELVQGIKYFYGTTPYGGYGGPGCAAEGCGTVFKMTLSGTLTTLHNFCAQSGCPDGVNPGGRAGPGHEWEVLRDH